MGQGLVYGSVCSGIEAASVAWEPLGWSPAFFSEIDAFPRAVLSHHWPEVPLHGDFTTIEAGRYRPIDLLVGGTPCQSFSVAGLRGGLADDRGNLALEYLRLADRLRPRWLVWENVPGVLSSGGGRDFGSILGGMVELGYGFAYRVLDAQFFGVAQRRRRVFVVGYLGDWRRAAAVLFERHSLSGHPAPRREAGQGTAGSLAARAGRGFNGQEATSDQLIARCDTTREGRRHDPTLETYVAHSLRAEGFDASEDGTGRGTPLVPVCFSSKDHGADAETDLSPTLRAGGHSESHANAGVPPAIAFALRGREGGAMPEVSDGVSALRSASGGSSRDYVAIPLLEIGKGTTSRGEGQNGTGLGNDCDPMFTLQAGAQHGVAVSPIAETMYGVSHADASQTGPDQALRALRDAVGPEAYSEWGLGILAALWPPEVLRPEVHGGGVRRQADDRHELGDDALSRSEGSSAGAVRRLWSAGCDGRPPRGWKPPERLSLELGAHLSELSHQGASPARFLLGLWRASEGLGLLREALSALQAAWRPDHREGQSAPLTSAVRRLTPRECERLMGFPDGHTAITYRGKPAADGPRYKALGNSFAVPVVAWIGRRIQAVEELTHG